MVGNNIQEKKQYAPTDKDMIISNSFLDIDIELCKGRGG